MAERVRLLPSLLFAVLIGVLVWGVLRLSSSGALARAGAVAATPGPPPRDPALEELRVRYARGELDRRDFLERSPDLGGPPIAPDTTSPGEPPPPEQE